MGIRRYVINLKGLWRTVWHTGEQNDKTAPLCPSLRAGKWREPLSGILNVLNLATCFFNNV
jgi:hypothetical protein